jgi:hypothetical protein
VASGELGQDALLQRRNDEAFAWRRGSVLLVGFLLVALVGGGLVAWISPDLSPPLIPEALSPYGVTAGGELGFGVQHADHVYYLGLPPLENTSDQLVRILGFRIAATSDNVQVLGYQVYSYTQFGNRVLTGYDPSLPEPGIDFEGTRPLRLPYVIPAHGQSKRFAMVKVRLHAYPPPGYAKDCIVTYQAVSSALRYSEHFDCTFYFGDNARDYFDGRTTLDVVNSYAHSVRLVNCPFCGSKGALIPGLPYADAGGGGVVGWELSDNDPRTVTVVVAGRRIICRPPTGAAATVYAVGHGPDLTYDITPTGRCILQR